MEKESKDQSILALTKQIKELEAALGRQTMETNLYKHILEFASEEYKTDLKKSFGSPLSKRKKQ
jgi:hypothetical protein